MYIILEQNGTDNTNIDGGAFNNFTAGNRDGILKNVLNECTLSALGNTISIGTGVLMVQGIRIKITEPETLSVSGTPSEPIRYQIIAQVLVNNKGDISFLIFSRLADMVPLLQNNIYKNGVGTYQVEIGRFTHDTDGSITEIDRNIDIISGGISGGAVVSVGEVTTEEISAGLPAEVDIDVGDKGELNFDFKLPQASVADGSVTIEKLDANVRTSIETSTAEITKIKNGTTAVGDSAKLGGVAASAYAKTADLSTVAISGSYNDLSNKPTITDTKNTAGSTDTSSKIFLVGATSQAANPQTYSHDTVYVDTSGCVNSATPSQSDNSTKVATTAWVKTLLKTIYPVGSVYISFSSTNPASFIGGDWTHLNSKFLYSATSSSQNVSSTDITGGSETVTLTVNQIPRHTHNSNTRVNWSDTTDYGPAFSNGSSHIVIDKNKPETTATGGGQSHNNLPPFVRVHMWRRIA